MPIDLQLSTGDEVWLQTPVKKQWQQPVEVLKIMLKKLKITNKYQIGVE